MKSGLALGEISCALRRGLGHEKIAVLRKNDLHRVLMRDEAGGGRSTVSGFPGLVGVRILSRPVFRWVVQLVKDASDGCTHHALMAFRRLYAWVDFLKHSRLES